MIKNKEWLRKKIVNLKRNPQIIPILLLSVSCVVFNLNLTSFTNTIALINIPGMGFIFFVCELLSFLMIVTLLGAYPRHQQKKYILIGLVCFMNIISIVCQAQFHYYIRYATVLKDEPIIIDQTREYVNAASSISIVHIVLLLISLASVILLPLYHKLLCKIDTSVKLEENKIIKVDIEE